MTRDEIIEMALDAGLGPGVAWPEYYPTFERFAALVAAAEREACAKVCEEQAARSEASMAKAKSMKDRDIYSAAGQTAHWIAAAIHARGASPNITGD